MTKLILKFNSGYWRVATHYISNPVGPPTHSAEWKKKAALLLEAQYKKLVFPFYLNMLIFPPKHDYLLIVQANMLEKENEWSILTICNASSILKPIW